MATFFSNVKERVLKIPDFKGISKEFFFEDLGISYGNFKGKAREKSLSSDTLATIVAKYPEVNPVWLLTGKGEMLLKDDESRGNIAAGPPATYLKKNLIPLYNDVESIGGSAVAANGNESPSRVEYIDAGDWFPGATAAIRHYGDSMKEYPSGCILALKAINDLKDGFVPGCNYVVEYGDDWNRVTKRIQKKEEEVWAYSTNKETYPDGTLIHQPFKLRNIHRAWRVLGSVIKTESSNGVINVIGHTK